MPSIRSVAKARIGKAMVGLVVVLAFCGMAREGEGQALPRDYRRANLKVYRSIMDPKNVSDIFGKRIAKRFVAVQVTITNRSQEFDFLIHDLSLDFKQVDPNMGRLSSRELSILRGVFEKGQSLDARNFILRLMRGSGTIAAGLIGLNIFGSTYPESVAVFNGPVILAYTEMFPDFTVNQLIRLNDSAYLANTIVPRRQARVVVVFLPQAIFLNKQQRKKFWKEPTQLWDGKDDDDVDLRKLVIWLDGNFIAEVEDIGPQIAGVIIEPGEMEKFGDAKPEVRGAIIGRFLAGATITLLNGPPGLSLSLAGVQTDKRLEFIIRSSQPVERETVLEFGIAKGGFFRRATITVRYQPRDE